MAFDLNLGTLSILRMGKFPINGLVRRGFYFYDSEENIFGQSFKLRLWKSCKSLKNKRFWGFEYDVDKIEGCDCHSTGVNRPKLGV